MQTGSKFTIKPGEYNGKKQLCAYFNVLNPRLVNGTFRKEVGFPQEVLEARNRPEEQLALTQLRKANASVVKP